LEARQFGGGDPGDDIAALRELTLSLNHAAEAAIRSWAGNNHGVRDAVERVDHNRIRTVQRAISRTISDTRKAEVMTSLGMDMLVGHQLRGGADDMDRFSAVLDEFLTLVYSHRTQQAS
ncbi:MAG TPA: hypothetical protein VLI04_18745, partial [Nocardioidaceae bacterium]|nr:hypothetical protein [Nocardioidaceae bacterium]